MTPPLHVAGPGPDLPRPPGPARLQQAAGLRPVRPVRHGPLPAIRRQRHPLLVSSFHYIYLILCIHMPNVLCSHFPIHCLINSWFIALSAKA